MSSRKKLLEYAEQRAQAIDEYIKSNKKCDVGMVYNAFQSDKIEPIKVYELPRNLLRLNPNNGRFKAELYIIQQDRKKESKSIELDSENSNDIKTIQEMIKGEYPSSLERKSAYKNLKENIKEVAQKTGTNGQEVPGLITYDGILINGNRRWVVMEELAEVSPRKKGEPLKYDKIRVARLGKNTDRYALWKNEAKEQISQESREEYDYVNSALEIKYGHKLLIDQGMSDKKAKHEIVKTLYGRDEKDVEGYLHFLEMADLFLEMMGKEEEYTYIQESGQEKGIITILQDAAKELEKHRNAGMSVDDLHKWLTAVCAFCVFSKQKPIVKLTDGIEKKLSFGHREYRNFQKKIMYEPKIRSSFLESPIIDEIDVTKTDTKDATNFYNAIREHQEEYDITMDISTPVSLLKKANNSLSKVNQDLAGTRKPAMIKQIKNELGQKYISDMKKIINEIAKKINSST